MSEQKPITPLLDGFVVGNPMSIHNGVRCCPALKENTTEKYIVKIISVPASQVQLDALLLTGAYKDPAQAMDYFKEVANEIVKEAEFLNTAAKLEGFLPYEGWQIVPMEDGKLGYEVYLLSPYKRSLLRYMQKNPVTHLEAVNLGLDLCTALAICRRAGYLYVDLKPANIFLSKGKEFRIGDLGFIPMDSLAYTSMPGKYRSPYAPPEAQDDLKTLNATEDTYAVGMILYQIYNNGTLPAAPLEPKDPFPCPANADYEISAIIMKAVDPDPANRWQNPMDMGQALVGYMQRNSVNNVPITPPAVSVSEYSPVPSQTEEIVKAEEPEVIAPEVQESVSPVVEVEIPSEPEVADETVPAETDTPIDEMVSNDVEEDVPPVSAEIFQEEDLDDLGLDDLDFSIAFQDTPVTEEPIRPAREKAAPSSAEILQQKKRNRKQNHSAKKLIPLLIAMLILALLACGAFWFYQTLYLKTIDDLTVDGSQNQLTVYVKTDMSEEYLQVTCTDTYGNSVTQAVVNGQSTFTDLLPDSLYRIELSSKSFHELTGKTADIFTTDALTKVTSLSAITGPEDGSVMLNFTVDGSDPDEWVVTCSAEGENDVIQSFTGHSITVKGLTIGKEYVIQLGSKDGSPILGESTTTFTATQLILAKNLTIVSCVDGIMTVQWEAPEGSSVERWGLRCYNDQGHEEVLEISGTEFAFTGIDSNIAYTVEVTAVGMTEPNRVSITANPLTVTNVTVDSSAQDQLVIDWQFDGETPEGGWLLLYYLDGYEDQQSVVKCSEPRAVIDNRIPGAEYTFLIQAADSTSIFNNIHKFTCPNAPVFTNEGLSADKITAHLLKTPAEANWTYESAGKDALTDTFQSGDKISVVLKADDSFYLPEMTIDVLYVIRDENGRVLSSHIARETQDWKALWYDDDYHNGELDIPSVPKDAGSYTISIYFNNCAVASTNFTITQ